MHWQGGLKEATEVAGDLEVLTKDLIAPQVFSLRAAGDIVELVLKRKINVKQLHRLMFVQWEMFRGG